MKLILYITTIVLGLAGCADLERKNPGDPKVGGGDQLRGQLVGTWSRADVENDEVYFFKADGGVERRDYSSPSGEPVDRNASFPQTLVVTFSGTYTLNGNVLTLSFRLVQTTDPGGQEPLLPQRDQVMEIRIDRGNTLTLKESDGDRFYVRL